MTAPNVVLFTPVRFDATSYIVRVTINGTTENLTFPATGSLTLGRDYWATGDGQSDGLEATGTAGKGDLLRKLFLATLRTHSQGASCTVTVSSSTWQVTCTAGGSLSMSILWSHASTTLDAEIFGWRNDADSSSGTSVTSTYAVRGVCLPGRAIAEDSLDYLPVVGGVASSLSGIVRASRLTAPARQRDIVLRYLTETNAIDSGEAAHPSSSVEYAWTEAISKGWPLRLYTQASDVAARTYKVYRTRSFDYPLARDSANSVWWTANLALVREAVATFSNTYSLSMGSTSDRVDFGVVTDLNGVTKASWSFWVRPSAFAITQNYVGCASSFGSGASNQWRVWNEASSAGYVGIAIGNVGPGTWRTTSVVLTTNTWYHVVLTWDAAAGSISNAACTCYINGVAVTGSRTGSSFPASLPAAGSTPTRVGGFTGNMDEIAIWPSRVLTAAEALEVYHSGRPGNLLALSFTAPSRWWRFENNYTDEITLATGTAPAGSPAFSTTVP